MTTRPSRTLLGPVGLVLIGILSVQLGAAIAKGLFGEISPTAMVWLRLVTSALVLAAIARPRLAGPQPPGLAGSCSASALSLATMNWAIYQSFSRIPLGIAVTIEFIGPLTLAVLGSRRARDVLWVLLAGAGRGPPRLPAQPTSTCSASCTPCSPAQRGRRTSCSAPAPVAGGPGFDGLAVASIIAAAGMTLPALLTAGSGLWDGRILLIGALVGLLSSVIPYSCELVALRSLRPAVFGILMSLEPAAAALAAIVVLHEHLTAVQWLAIACVVAASIGATRSALGARRAFDPHRHTGA